jgi:transcriptional regulator with XRE-family HTH domain
MSIKSKITQNSINSLEKIAGSKLTLGRLITSIRKCDGITQLEFAKKLGISRQQLCDIEHDRKIISPKRAALYAEILGYSSKQFVRFALQAILDKAGISYNIELELQKTHSKRRLLGSPLRA